jgi:hypothetical protein
MDYSVPCACHVFTLVMHVIYSDILLADVHAAECNAYCQFPPSCIMRGHDNVLATLAVRAA